MWNCLFNAIDLKETHFSTTIKAATLGLYFFYIMDELMEESYMYLYSLGIQKCQRQNYFQ